MQLLRTLTLGYAVLKREHPDGSEERTDRPRAVAASSGAPEPKTTPRARRSRLGAFGLIRQTYNQFNDDDCLTMGAALAYYTTFSLAPLLLVVIAVAGIFLGRQVVEGRLHDQIASLIGTGAANQISTMLRGATENKSAGMVSAIIGIVAIIAGATSAFAQLQSSLNQAWQVKPDPRKSGIKSFIFKRLLSLGMVLSIGFLLLVSLALSAALTGLNDKLQAILPGFLSAGVLEGIHIAVSFVLITVLFAAIFKVLPDVKLSWHDVWVGAAITSVLFTVGKFLIGFYLGRSATTSSYGAAASLVVIILWVYYASLILLAGAEFAVAWTENHRAVEPEPGAIRVNTRTPETGYSERAA